MTNNNFIRYENTVEEVKVDKYQTFERITQFFINPAPFKISSGKYEYVGVLVNNQQSFAKNGTLEFNQFYYELECTSIKSKILNFYILLNLGEDFNTKFQEKALMAEKSYIETIKSFAEQKEIEENNKRAAVEKKQTEELKDFLNKSKEKRAENSLLHTIEERTNYLLENFNYEKTELTEINNFRGIRINDITVFDFIQKDGVVYKLSNFEELNTPTKQPQSKRMEAIDNCI